MNKLCTSLQEWGCDIDGAMKRFLNDEELYQSCLLTMLADANFEKLGKAIEAKDVKEAFEAAHSLKGTLGNMGLTPMFEKSVDIVERLRRSSFEGVESFYKDLMDFKTHLEQIKNDCIKD